MPETRTRLRKHRFEALSDGVFAIAMTLLVLEIKLPEDVSGSLRHALLQQSHALVSFIITFAIASVFWVFQHKLFDVMEAMSHRTIVPTFIFLGLVSLLPFTTGVWGHHITDRSAFVLYFLNQMLIGLALTAKYYLAKREGLMMPGVESATLGVRLFFLTLVMTAAAVSAAFLPMHVVWTVPVSLAVVGRVLRSYLKKRYLASSAEEQVQASSA